MDRLRQALKSGTPYEHVETEDVPEDGIYEEEQDDISASVEENEFSWLNYTIFLLLGVAMLWAWYATFNQIPLQVFPSC